MFLVHSDSVFEEALAEAEKAIEVDPNYAQGHWVLGLAYRAQGRYEEAITAHKRAVEISRAWQCELGCTYAAAGRTDEARKILDEVTAREARSPPWRAFWLAQLHTALGEKDEAFRWLNYEYPHAWLPWIRVWPELEPLRNDPRFLELMDRMNLPPP
jgi:tetratricopeptide (TPR) repeat protein